MKTKPLVLATLVVTAALVSLGSARVINHLSRAGSRVLTAHRQAAQAQLAPKIAAGVAKAAARMLVCRFQS